jgi:heat shock protein HslJ
LRSVEIIWNDSESSYDKRMRLCCVWAVISIVLTSCASAPAVFTKASAIATVHRNLRVGDGEARAIAKMQRAGFRCRQLAPHEYGTWRLDPIKVMSCHAEADRTAEGYTLVYASLTFDRHRRLVEMHADSYPVVYRNLRKDHQGRTVVVQDVRPVVASVSLQGRWTITTVNGRQSDGLWLELGGEGIATVTKRGNSIYVASPQPQTRSYLGCNDWYPSGWTRNGDKLTLGREMSRRTERGCDAARMALDDQAYAILHETMTMELMPPNRLRLINEKGTLDLVRNGS